MGKRHHYKRSNRRWTEDERSSLAAFLPEYTDRQISILLDRSPKAIAAARREMTRHEAETPKPCAGCQEKTDEKVAAMRIPSFHKALWVVQAEEGCDSSGGLMTLLIATPDEGTPPDVLASYAAVRGRDSCSLYRVSSIRLLGSFEIKGGLLVDLDE